MGITQQIGASSLIKAGVIDNTAARPASPYEGQVIYQKDTDEVLAYNGTAWTRPTNMPWGVMAYMVSSTNPTVSTTTTDVTGVSVTWTAVANRLYRITFEGFVGCGTSSQNQFFFTDSSNNILDSWYHDIGAGQFASLCLVQILTSTAGSRTVKLRATTSAGTMTFYGTSGRAFTFVVEDIGPA
jgi:hypothetical protein